MKLGEFIEKFVENNSLVRLVYKTKSGHITVGENWDVADMEWQILKGEGSFKNCIDNKVIGVTDIIVGGICSEAINIVIER